MLPIVYAFQRLYNCGIDSADSCEEAYAKYIVCYNKTRDERKMQIFCGKFDNLKTLEQSCPECNVNGIMDKEIQVGGVTPLKQRSRSKL